MSTATAPETLAPTRYSGRILGLDLARAVAILGMFYAHLYRKEPGTSGIEALLESIPDGRSAILFSLLAGVSLAILTGRNVPYTQNRMRHAQMRIAGRGLLLIAFGALLTWLGTAVIVILGYYGFWFLLAIPFVRWSAKKLFIAAGVTAIAGPILMQLLKAFFLWRPFNVAFTWSPDPNYALNGALFEGASYPGLQYMAFVFLGMALGRLDLTSRRLHVLLTLVGSGVAILSYALAFFATSAFGTLPYGQGYDAPLGGHGPSADPLTGDIQWPAIDVYLTADPHTGTVLEAVASGGFAAATLGLCLLVGPLGRHVLRPLVSLGSMSLTAYATHIVAIALWPSLFYDSGHSGFLLVSVVIIAACFLWKFVATRGPLEWVLWKFSLWFAKLPGDDADRAPKPAQV